MEKPTENTIKEAHDHPEKGKMAGLEISSQGQHSKEVIEHITSLHEAVGHDTPITKEGLDNLNQSLSEMKIDFGGVEMTAEEAEKDPNVKIWLEIKAGNLGDYSLLEYINTESAQILSKKFPDIWLNNLKILSVPVAEVFSMHYQGNLYLDGLKTLSDDTAKYLAISTGYLSLNGLVSLSDTASEYLSHFRGIRLDLTGLRDVSDTVAMNLAKIDGLSLNAAWPQVLKFKK
jgi:hypothetical protein